MKPEYFQTSTLIQEKHLELARRVVELEFAANPALLDRFGAVGKAKSVQDACYHFSFLAQAVELDRPEIFEDYSRWARVVLEHRKMFLDDLLWHLKCMAAAVNDRLPQQQADIARTFIEAGMKAAQQTAPETEGRDEGPQLARDYVAALLACDKERAFSIVLDRRTHMALPDLYVGVLKPALYEVGRRWERNEITVAQEHYCCAVTQVLMSRLGTGMGPAGVKSGRCMVSACVGAEVHDIGARMVAEILEVHGWEAVFIGATAPPGDLLRTVIDRRADLLALSCTYAPNLREAQALIHTIRALPETRHLRVIVGGYAFNGCPGLWQQIGADGWSEDGCDLIEVVDGLFQA